MRIVGRSMLSALKRLSVSHQNQTILARSSSVRSAQRNPESQSQRSVHSQFGKMSLPERKPFTPDFFFRQLFDGESSTYSYLLADLKTGEAVIIDPVLEQAKRDAQLVKELGFKLKYVINGQRLAQRADWLPVGDCRHQRCQGGLPLKGGRSR
ncbi:persulfide dioxygenase ETHE1 homolog, mitochondrial-like isoform X2 [Drosophila miranda]|uniref:persulfide dioxygenase ETHE1 homolog, mitochondrial-like isoform X2 n=1 Tax=Drosophila miranda TaxID=7229 RepID=UPI00143F8914|nr:persulfide dioxygenase ETHE1 homolog, mitochondrial-like isoform X2 [Drosophila miranda]